MAPCQPTPPVEAAAATAAMDPEERRKRHDLNYGVYNFRDVKLHFRKLGWRFMPGPELSYDHYYVKPGKNPRNPKHKEGEDYFLGEAALVAYARKEEIFGPETVPFAPAQPEATHGSARGKRRASNSSETTIDLDSYSEHDSDSSHQSHHHHEHKRKRRGRRSSSEHKIGNTALNPIALSSDSSGGEEAAAADNASSVEEEEEEWAEEDTGGGFYQDEDDDGEEADASEAAPSSSSEDEVETDDLEEDDLEIVEKGKTLVPHGKARSFVEALAAKHAENGKGKAKAKAKATVKSEKKSLRPAADKGPRPLLKTSNGKHKKAKRWKENGSADSSGASAKRVSNHSNGHSHSKKRHGGVMRVAAAKKKKSAPRSLLESSVTKNDEDGRWHDNEDNTFDLGVEQFGESPPRRPPSKEHSRSRSKSTPCSPATSAVTASPPPAAEAAEEDPSPTQATQPTQPTQPEPTLEEEEEKRMPGKELVNSHSFMSSNHAAVSGRVTPVAPPNRPAASSSRSSSSRPSNCVSEDSSDLQTWMDLTEAVLPPDRDSKYHIRVTVSSGKPPVTTVWLENMRSHEQRTHSFTDVQELPGAKFDTRVPTVTVLTALFRYLSSQPDAVVLVGPEPRATVESKTAFEKGEVELRTSTAEKSAGNNDDGNGLTLVVTYPALDLYRVEHNFPLKLVSTDQRLQHLTDELKRMKEQLALIQNDRDKLCEQLRHQEEENERKLARRVETRVKERLASETARRPDQQDVALEQRVEKLVQERTQPELQTQEKEKRDRDRARRWVYVRSDWMTAFYPCRSLTAATGGEGETSLLRPTTATSVRKHVVEWHEIVEFAEPFFQPTVTGTGGAETGSTFTRAVTVCKDGLYQVNVNVSHDSLVHMWLVVTPDRARSSGDDGSAAAKDIAPTKVLLYDNKRRVSRVDQTLQLRALDEISVELRLLDSTGPNSGPEEWLRTPMPTHNRLMVVVLDEHRLH